MFNRGATIGVRVYYMICMPVFPNNLSYRSFLDYDGFSLSQLLHGVDNKCL